MAEKATTNTTLVAYIKVETSAGLPPWPLRGSAPGPASTAAGLFPPSTFLRQKEKPMHTLRRPTVLLAVVGTLALATAGSAVADTNKSQQSFNSSGSTAPLLSPATPSRPDNGQSSQQTLDKADTTNWAVIDYVGRESDVAHASTSDRAHDMATGRTTPSESDLEDDAQRAQELAAS
ncbi:hypothetical protein [Streptomyces sp. SudanB182_2057]|uniref:hypothetical protein n=1 Tax=Streptomyces sp. SudanB182_2057 TaxID=3035281 RepID=UPI003F57EB23